MALRELLHADVLYQDVDARSDLAPYDASLLSVSDGGKSAVPLVQLLDADDAFPIDGERHGLLCPEADLSLGEAGKQQVIRPYMCPVLRERREYIQFIKTLVCANMLRPGGHKKATVTPFFVRKKDGRIRLVLDARQVNQFFRRPKKVELGSGAALAQLECEAGETLYFATSDLNDAFYVMGIPDWLSAWFSLPSLSVAEAREVGLLVGAWGGGARVYPQLTVLPMGWSWGGDFCQKAHGNVLIRSNVVDLKNRMTDFRMPPKFCQTQRLCLVGVC